MRKSFLVPLVLIVLLNAGIAGVLLNAQSQLQRAPAPATRQLDRVVDSTFGVVCYAFQDGGSPSCVKLVR